MKVFKRLIVLILLFGVAHGMLLLTNNLHFYNTLKQTVFKGRLGPAIDEYNVFENRRIQVAEHQAWNEATDKNSFTIPDPTILEFEKLKTVAFLVIQDDEIIHEQYWEGYSDSSLSNSFSMAKSILNIAIGSLIREGKIGSLDDPISKYLPAFDVSNYPELSIRHLLQMSSGINFDENYINPFAYPAKANYGNDLVSLTYSYKADKKPGEHFEYRSGNSQLLSFIITEASGMSTSAYVSEKIWMPIGAKHAALWSLDRKDGFEKGFCCFNSNARDFARIGKLFMNKGVWNGDTIVSPSFVEASLTPAPIVDADGNQCKRYGLHWWLHNYNGQKVYYARGILGQYIIAIPDLDVLIVRLGHKRVKPSGVEAPEDLDLYINTALEIIAAN